jgi:hypothetical protein
MQVACKKETALLASRPIVSYNETSRPLPFLFLFLIFWGGWDWVHLVLLGLLYQPRVVGDCGVVSGMRIGRGNRSARREPSPASLCPPQIANYLTWYRTRAADVGSHHLTAWAVARLRDKDCSIGRLNFCWRSPRPILVSRLVEEHVRICLNKKTTCHYSTFVSDFRSPRDPWPRFLFWPRRVCSVGRLNCCWVLTGTVILGFSPLINNI